MTAREDLIAAGIDPDRKATKYELLATDFIKLFYSLGMSPDKATEKALQLVIQVAEQDKKQAEEDAIRCPHCKREY